MGGGGAGVKRLASVLSLAVKWSAARQARANRHKAMRFGAKVTDGAGGATSGGELVRRPFVRFALTRDSSGRAEEAATLEMALEVRP